MRAQFDARASSRPGASTRADQLLEGASARLVVGELVEGRAGRRQEHDVALAGARGGPRDGRLEIAARLAADGLPDALGVLADEVDLGVRGRRPQRREVLALALPAEDEVHRRGERGEPDERRGDVRSLRVVDVEDAVDAVDLLEPVLDAGERRKTGARIDAAGPRGGR